MEASGSPAPAVEAAPAFDVSEVHRLLDEAEKVFHEVFGGDHAPSTRSHVERVSPHLETIRNIVDLAAQEAAKE